MSVLSTEFLSATNASVTQQFGPIAQVGVLVLILILLLLLIPILVLILILILILLPILVLDSDERKLKEGHETSDYDSARDSVRYGSSLQDGKALMTKYSLSFRGENT